MNSPGWSGSVDWVLACKPKGLQLDSRSGHMPGLRARSPVVGAWEAPTHWCFSPSLSPSLPLSLKINKTFKIYIFHEHIEMVGFALGQEERELRWEWGAGFHQKGLVFSVTFHKVFMNYLLNKNLYKAPWNAYTIWKGEEKEAIGEL